jgi:hypothetical protein
MIAIMPAITAPTMAAIMGIRREITSSELDVTLKIT